MYFLRCLNKELIFWLEYILVLCVDQEFYKSFLSFLQELDLTEYSKDLY